MKKTIKEWAPAVATTAAIVLTVVACVTAGLWMAMHP